jgi:hypothetical protein
MLPDTGSTMIAAICSHGAHVVVGQHDRVARSAAGHTRRRRDAQRDQAGARRDEQRVGVAVVVAVELHELVAAGVSACEADRAHGRLCAGGDHAHHLDGGHDLHERLGHADLELGRGAETGALHELLAHGVQHDIGRVTQDHRAPRADEVDVLVAVRVPHPVALGVVVEDRRRADGAERAHRRVDAAGDDLDGLGHQLL